jgi:hypothetical protein
MGSEREQGGDDNKDITDEMDAYYESKNSRSGSTILYGLFALVVTLIVAAGLFFGGRAVYRALTGTSGDSETATTQEEENPSSTSGDDNDNGQTGGSDNQTPGVDSDTPGADGGSGSNQSNNGSSSEDMPSTGDNLPSTGSPTGI